jgi:hypothetical protein
MAVLWNQRNPRALSLGKALLEVEGRNSVEISSPIRSGKLTQIGIAFRTSSTGQKRAVFQCECGKKIVSLVTHVRNSKANSCGCVRAKKLGEMSKGNSFSKKHGMSNTRTYISWSSMLDRCLNENATSYFNYGKKGVTVCDRWVESFSNFLEDMGHRPVGCSIDRIENSIGYSKENCRWASMKQQSRNRRTNHFIEIDGVSKTISEWSEISGVSKVTILSRLKRGRIPVRNCVFDTPLRRKK